MKIFKFVAAHSNRFTVKQTIVLFMIIFCLSVAGNGLYAEELKGTITIGGTGTALGSFKELAEAFQKTHPDVKINILPSIGSGGGIKAVNEGSLDIGLSSRLLKDSEKQQGTMIVEYARTPFVFATAQKIEGLNFTLQDLAKIFSGETKTWADGTPIRLVLRPDTDMDTVLIKDMSPEIKEAVQKALLKDGMMVAATDQEAADALEKNRGAIGTSTLTQIISEKRALNILQLNGIKPSLKTLEEGKYSYYKTLYVVTSTKSDAVTKNFINFINSKEGRDLLMKTGHLPF